jgi:hypothetical protein
MSYGLVIQTRDGAGNVITQIDTSKGLTNYVVSRKGTGSSVPGYFGTGISQLLFVKPSASYLRFANEDTKNDIFFEVSGTSVSFKRSLYNSSDNIDSTIGASCDWFVLQDVTGVTPTGNYGLVTYSALQQVEFDTRRFLLNNSCNILSVKPGASLSGGGAGISSSLIHTDIQSTYVNIDWASRTSYYSRIALEMLPTGNNMYYINIRNIPGGGQAYDSNWGPIFLAKLL